ncbi:pentatricopeptide repeat-containing protein At1g31920 [Phoenix dactylifera]|uniref:Pentatricopeptide repeat-containing protein At1g31920 n=1 Tax=Phoenix dactylifera TaxID=42345 RepID=A0A8B7BZH6_PHODC|nr:pentatricopeptide repeat-containing protein At1g31920 [Phoenix dactylifera]
MAGSLSLHQTQQFIAPPNNIPQVSENRPREQTSFPPLPHQLKTILEFRKVHAQYIKLGLDRVPRHAGDLLSACALSDWGSMDYACSIFLSLDDPGTFDFNTMIRAHVKDNDPEAALLLYKETQERIVRPDNFTFPFALKACAQLSAAGEGMQIHGHVTKLGFQCDIFVQNSLIYMYGKCGEINLCCRVFKQMGSDRTVASWSAILAAHTRMGLWNECLKLFAMMTAEGLRADESSMVSALSSCAHLGTYDLGRSIHCSLLRNISGLNVIVQTSLIDMYLKCGCLEKGMAIFDRMPQRNKWTFSAVISGLAMHGDGEKVLQILSNMLKEGIEPDEAIYVGVLSACSHAGLLEDGFWCFDQMRLEHRIIPNAQHYGCMVDLISQAGKLNEAYEMIRSMPMGPTDVAWRCLLNACKIHGNLELAECAHKNLMQLDVHNAGDHIILSNMYAEAQRWDDAARIRAEMADRGVLQVPGYSRVEVKGRMHTFVSHDKSHPKNDEVYEMLHQMEWQLRFEGYTPDTSLVHSQKLAIAFSLVNTSYGTLIRVVTNLRMNKECHTYTALISKIFEREIIIRDHNRFHCFRQGACSCGGYW